MWLRIWFISLQVNRNDSQPFSGFWKPKYCREVVKLPTRSSEYIRVMSQTFIRAFQCVYQKSYRQVNVMHFGTNDIQWCEKFAFTDPKTEHRTTIKMGDFVNCQEQLKGRIYVIFVHTLHQKRRLFAKKSFQLNVHRKISDIRFVVEWLCATDENGFLTNFHLHQKGSKAETCKSYR